MTEHEQTFTSSFLVLLILFAMDAFQFLITCFFANYDALAEFIVASVSDKNVLYSITYVLFYFVY